MNFQHLNHYSHKVLPDKLNEISHEDMRLSSKVHSVEIKLMHIRNDICELNFSMYFYKR